MTEIRIIMQSEVAWNARPTAGGKRWMAECDALGLAMEGDSLDELHSLIAESCHLLFEDLLKDGELEKFLEARGWSLAEDYSTEQVGDEVEFDFPWHLVTKGAPHGPRHRTH